MELCWNFSKNESNNTEVIQLKKSEFKDRIKFEENPETIYLLQLQEKYEKGLIKEEDISDVDYENLCNLYDEQISKINKETELYKKKILEIRKNIK